MGSEVWYNAAMCNTNPKKHVCGRDCDYDPDQIGRAHV